MVGDNEAVTTNLLCLRPGAGAADDYEAIFTEPQVERWIRPEPLKPFRREDLEQMARRDRAHWDRHGFGPWVVRERESGELVGRGGLSWATVDARRQIELPWAVVPQLQKRGYATEMAEAAIETARQADLGRLVSLTLVENQASRRVMEKIGLTYIGEIDHVGFPHFLYEIEL